MNNVRKIVTASALAVLQISLASAAPVLELPTGQPIPLGIAKPRIDEGLAALDRGDLAAAEAAFKAALALDPSVPTGYLGLAEVAGRRGDDALTEDWPRKGLRHADPP